MKIVQKVVLFMCLVFPLWSSAAVPRWQIEPNESSITFTATQNNAPVKGSFKQFTGDIQFDPNQLKASQVKIVVYTGSVSASYSDVVNSLKQKEWLNTTIFPQAVFKSSSFLKTGENTFQAKGTLTVRNKTVPVTVFFTQQEYSATKAVMKGTAILKRTQFGVGQGEWADTNAVKDEVRVDFVIAAVRK